MTDLFEVDVTTTSLDLRRLQREQRRRERRARALIAIAIALVIFGLAASSTWNLIQSWEPEEVAVADYEDAGQGSVRVVIKPGDRGDQIAKTLLDAGVVASTTAFLEAWTANADLATSIAPGYYNLQKEMKAEFALLALLDSANREVLRITIPEGWTVEQIVARISAVTEYSEEDVNAALADTTALGLPAEANGSVEGWLFPLSYTFNPDVHPEDVFSAMIQATVSRLETAGVPRDKWLRTLTIASLIEREAKLDEDRPIVAGVIQNRLDADRTLELDSTVHYIFRSTGDAFTTPEQRKSDSKYNTYRFVGLPPGPIAAPGDASLKAALEPAKHDYLYFVTVNLVTGETKYAKTLQAHLQNVEILREWIAKNES